MSCAGAASILLLLWLRPVVGEYSSQSLSTFVDTMLAEYDREEPPAARTLVELALDVRHGSVDERRASMILLADLTMSWNDSRVSWNASAWAGDAVLVTAQRLWRPPVELVSAGGREAGVGLRARISAAGAVRTVSRLQMSVPLALQLHNWPRDQQEAVFKFASTSLDQNDVELQIVDYKQSVVVESGAWEVVGVSGRVMRWVRGEGAGDGVPLAAWTVRVARRGAAAAASARAVLAAVAVTLLAAAALPYEQRPPLAAAAAFIPAMWLVTAIFHLPSAASTPCLVRVMCALAGAGAASSAAAALTTRLAARAAPPPPALRALLTRLSTVYTLAPDPESNAWAAAARLLDAVAVVLLVLTVLVTLTVHELS